MKIAHARFLAAAALAASLLVASGCGGGGTPAATGPVSGAGALAATPVVATTTTTVPSNSDLLSTFKSKDPFIQPVVATTVSTSTNTTSTAGGTTTTNPSQVTVHAHSLKVLSIDVANGTSVVTYQVDGVVYQDQKVGDVSSTSWGEIKVVSINSETQTVVLLQGSETRTLQVGQEYFK
jgi:hypothetical protein